MLYIHTILCLLLINAQSVLKVKAAEWHCKDGGLICYSLESSSEEEEKKYSSVNKNVLWGNSLWVLCSEKEKKRKLKNYFKFHQSEESCLGGNPHFPSLEMTLLSSEYRNTKWHAALSCCFLFFICIVSPCCCCYLRKTSQVRQRYLIAWQIFEWLATGLRRTPVTFWNQHSFYLNRCMSHRFPFPYISVFGTLASQQIGACQNSIQAETQEHV